MLKVVAEPRIEPQPCRTAGCSAWVAPDERVHCAECEKRMARRRNARRPSREAR